MLIKSLSLLFTNSLKIITLILAPQLCGSNEVYKDSGNDCQTCAHPHRLKCELQNSPGCYCDDGFVRDSNGACVAKDSCEKHS